MADILTFKKSNCKNCYKCIRYCPVKSIRFSGNQAHIVGDECILCGQCLVVCPQGAKQVADGVEKVQVLLQSGAPVYVSLAPSFAANYNGIGLAGMEKALSALGFAGCEETARGAAFVTAEYERLMQEPDRKILISSCCHSAQGRGKGRYARRIRRETPGISSFFLRRKQLSAGEREMQKDDPHCSHSYRSEFDL